MSKLVSEDGLHIVEEDDIRPPPHYRPGGPPQVVTADTARQGPLGLPVLHVLAASFVLIGIVSLLFVAFAR
jgi:hypothetical protein